MASYWDTCPTSHPPFSSTLPPSDPRHVDAIEKRLTEEISSGRMLDPFSREETERILRGPSQSSPLTVELSWSSLHARKDQHMSASFDTAFHFPLVIQCSPHYMVLLFFIANLLLGIGPDLLSGSSSHRGIRSRHSLDTVEHSRFCLDMALCIVNLFFKFGYTEFLKG